MRSLSTLFPPMNTDQHLPLHLIAFSDVEDELSSAPGTPDRDEYEDRVTKFLNVDVKIFLQPTLPQS